MSKFSDLASPARANSTGGHVRNSSIDSFPCIRMHQFKHVAASHHLADPAMRVHWMQDENWGSCNAGALDAG